MLFLANFNRYFYFIVFTNGRKKHVNQSGATPSPMSRMILSHSHCVHFLNNHSVSNILCFSDAVTLWFLLLFAHNSVNL